MTTLLVTVEQAAAELKLHPKTVLRHIREGRLSAARIGKGYRIARGELDRFAGITRSTRASRMITTTSIVDVPDLETESAERLATFLQSATLTGSTTMHPLNFHTAFDPASGAMKLVLIGMPSAVARLLEMIEIHLENQR